MSKYRRTLGPDHAGQQADGAVLAAAEEFVQQWIAHPRDTKQIGYTHAELIRAVLNRRAVREVKPPTK